MKSPRILALAVFALLSFCVDARAASTNEYLEFVRAQAASLRAKERFPTNLRQWEKQKDRLRQDLTESWGSFPKEAAPLAPQKLGELDREGYRIEKIIFQTFPGVWMTANAYMPLRNGRSPALLMVHGHWRGAKQDPTVQARCIGSVKLGFFVLAVDAFGAGERGIGKALGEYHGDMTAATLLPTGLALAGLQVYENMRAVDYLRSRPEVDGDRIGISGASGGGNQTMYEGAWDERLAAAAPVCSVGNYRAYLGAACCMCEVVPGALRFTEEWGLLGMVAPRALMVINASRDARQFSIEEAKKSVSAAGSVFDLFRKPDSLRQVTFDSGHDYNQAMREAVYGWMTLHLKNEGNGSPIPEPPVQAEDPETLRCFPGESRPEDWVTLPKFAAARAREIIAARQKRSPAQLRRNLVKVLGGFPAKWPLHTHLDRADGGETIRFSPEPGLNLAAHRQRSGQGKSKRLALIIDLEGQPAAGKRRAVAIAKEANWDVLTLSLRATGELAWPGDRVGRAPDHTSAQWGLWIGRPLLGQWVWDIRRTLDALKEVDGRLPDEIALVGYGPAGMVALATGALDGRVNSVITIGSMTTYISETPYEGQRMGIIVPGILKEVGDVSDIAALVTGQRVSIPAAEEEPALRRVLIRRE